MSYQAALDELNKNLKLYLQNKCEPPVNHLSKAMYQLTIAVEQDLKEQRKQIKALKDAIADLKTGR